MLPQKVLTFLYIYSLSSSHLSSIQILAAVGNSPQDPFLSENLQLPVKQRSLEDFPYTETDHRDSDLELDREEGNITFDDNEDNLSKKFSEINEDLVDQYTEEGKEIEDNGSKESSDIEDEDKELNELESFNETEESEEESYDERAQDQHDLQEVELEEEEYESFDLENTSDVDIDQEDTDDKGNLITFEQLLAKTPFYSNHLGEKFQSFFRISEHEEEVGFKEVNNDHQEDKEVQVLELNPGTPEYFRDPESTSTLRFPYTTLTEEDANSFRPKFEMMINGTWFHKHKYHELIQEGSGIDAIFAEMNDMLPMFYQPCLREEFSKLLADKEVANKYIYHEDLVNFNQYANNSKSETYAYFQPSRTQFEPVLYDIENVPREKYHKIRRIFTNVFYDVYLKDFQNEILKHLQVGYSSMLMYKSIQNVWLFGFMVNADYTLDPESESIERKATENCAYIISNYLTNDPLGLYLGKAPIV